MTPLGLISKKTEGGGCGSRPWDLPSRPRFFLQQRQAKRLPRPSVSPSSVAAPILVQTRSRSRLPESCLILEVQGQRRGAPGRVRGWKVRSFHFLKEDQQLRCENWGCLASLNAEGAGLPGAQGRSEQGWADCRATAQSAGGTGRVEGPRMGGASRKDRRGSGSAGSESHRGHSPACVSPQTVVTGVPCPPPGG